MKRAFTFLLTAALIFQSVMPHTVVYASEAEQEIISTDQQQSDNSEADHEAADKSNPTEETDSTDNSQTPTEETGSTDNSQTSTEETDATEDSQTPTEDNQISDENTTDSKDEPMAEDLEEIFLQLTLLSKDTPADNSLAQLGLTVDNNTITINSAADIILLSNCASQEYQNLTVNMPVSGTLDITGTASHNGVTYTFQGFGSSDYPFAGTFSGSGVTLTINRTLFNGLSSTANLNGQNIEWKGTTSQPMLAEEYSFADGEEHTFPIAVKIADDNTGAHNGYRAGNLIDKIVKSPSNEGTAGTLLIRSAAVDYNSSNNSNAIEISNNENAGLICNTLEAGTIKLNEFGYPSSFTVTAANGSAGGLIGKMGNGTALEVTNTNSVTTSTTITGLQNAGGIVGECDRAAVRLDNCSISSVLSSTNGGAGGFIGTATDTTITSANVTVDSLTASGVNAGGFFGSYMQSSGGSFTPAAGITIPEQVTLSLNGSNTAGGLFGFVELSNNACITVGGENNTSIRSELTGSILGGIAGQVMGSSTANTLTVKNCVVEYTKNGSPSCLGGVAGMLGSDEESIEENSTNVNSAKAAALVLDNVITSTGTPSAANAEDRNFGGAVGRLAEASVLDAKNLTVSTTDNITGGGAVVGNARPGSAVRLSKVTDLSNVMYTESANEGQIIGYQDSALIYALGSGNDYNAENDCGWTLKRSTTPYALDDIGNYGEVFRLKTANDSSQGLSSTLIQMDEITHNVTLAGSIDYAQIESVDDFARLAITWQTKGYFSGDFSINSDNWTYLNAKNLTITGDIDLSGTGVTGFTRDADMGNAYEGAMNGAYHIITLAIGEAYGMRENAAVTNATEGSGKIYRHGRLGLFAAANGSVSNLNIAGNIDAHAKSEMAVGGYAAYKTGNSEVGYTVSGVDIIPTLNIKADNKVAAVYVGGIYGILACDGAENHLIFESNNKEAAIINFGSAPTDYTHIGGVIGAVGEKSVTKIIVNDLTIGGSISSTDESEYCYAGGFIGTIWPSSSLPDGKIRKNVSIELKGLKIENFSLTEGSTVSAGGFLGYCWADSDVTFTGTSDTAYGLSVNNSSVIVENCQNLGGLVYRAGGGMWKVASYGIDMSGAVINGGTISLGLLVNYGFTSNVNLNGSSKNVASLYLNNTMYWGTAYQVAGCSITSTPAIFDEWVAYSAASASTICDNGKGIISLTTENGTVTMDGKDINTYKNRTEYGQNHITNNTSRYYYNLNSISNSISTGNRYIDTPEELLMWSVYHYADSKLRSYITFEDAPYGSSLQNRPIGTSNSNPVNLDMKGFSYYPINLTDMNLTVENASIKFYAEKIAEGETKKGNKTNIGEETKHTQHYTMHCGLLRNFYGNTPSIYTTSCTLNVKNVTIGGTVGVVNNAWSGALIYGSMKGISGRTSVVSIDGLTMDGLSVYNPENIVVYPILINCAYSYVTLSLTNITGNLLPNNAASSLIGGVGIPSADTNGTGAYKDATQIALSFSKIKLPDITGAFTRATLLESFRYNEGMVGSATYNFYKAEDQDHAMVTYGKEITETKEYPEMQLWYYDAGTYKQDTGLVFEGNATASGYLPYVKSEYTEGGINHEIKVNQRTTDIVVGCGSYGDPYVITEAETMQAIAAYMINSVSMPDHITLVDMQDDTTETNGGFELCTDSTQKHRTYEKDGSSWVEVEKNENNEWVKKTEGKKLANTTVHDYVLNAYYQIDGTIELENFPGLGNKDNVFRGVLVGKDNDSRIKITGGNSECLIPYSYGSVVKNLDIEYHVSKELTYSSPVSVSQNSAAINIYSTSFFGGVFGCILGGDNIIDSVSVNVSGVTVSESVEENPSHLIPTGAYVGLISGGGVIFRNNDGKTMNGTAIGNGFYNNPYVGRVLNGFAFSEGNLELENTDKNYKINKLTDGKCLDVNSTTNTIIVNNAQGLLVLSALVNSGAVSVKNESGNSYAYAYTSKASQDGYRFGSIAGKKRHANYDKIGNVSDSDDDYIEWNKSNWDDFRACRESSPAYLVYKYVEGEYTDETYSATKSTIKDNITKINKNASYICRNNGQWTIELVTTNPSTKRYDMAVFGSGFRGIGGRYTCNAINTNMNLQYSRCNPELNILKGNGATITLNTVVMEYADDDFHAASVGGLFNVLRTQNIGKESTIAENFTLTGTVSLKYYDSSQEEVAEITNGRSDSKDGKYCVSVGGFAGNSVAYPIYKNYVFDNICIRNAAFTGPNSAGSLMGSTGLSNSDSKSGFGIVLGNDSGSIWGIQLKNCSYDSISVTAGYAAGGFVGYVSAKARNSFGIDGGSTQISGVYSSDFNLHHALASNSTITVTKQDVPNSFAGGVFGFCGTNFKFHADGNENCKMQINNVTVNGGGYTGGVVGCEKGANDVIAKYLSIQSSKITSASTSGSRPIPALGGMFGCVGVNSDANLTINHISISGTTVQTVQMEEPTLQPSAGGVVGYLTSSLCANISYVTLTGNLTVDGYSAGGVVGYADDYCKGVKITNASVTASEGENLQIGYCKSNVEQSYGGILGNFQSSGTVVLDECAIQKVDIPQGTYCGGLIGNVRSDTKNVTVLNSSVQDSTVRGRAVAGGIVGAFHGTFNGSNILISNTLITREKEANNKSTGNNTGILLGIYGGASSGKGVYVAGLSIQPGDEYGNALLPDAIVGTKYNTSNTADTYTGYIAFTDYTGACLTNDGTQTVKDTEQKSPYAVTSPVSSIKVKETSDSDEVFLYGDGASWTEVDENNVKTVFTSNVESIYKDISNTSSNHFKYLNTGMAAESDFANIMSTYCTEQNAVIQSDGSSASTTVTEDFPVLRISSGATRAITDYLNIITNGGYSKALAQCPSHVKTTVSQYKWNGSVFVKEEGNNKPALLVLGSGTSNVSFVTSPAYDNGLDRFNLVTVTFTEEGEKYQVQIPVIVRRLLEIDFTATLDYGTNFNASSYEGLTNHILESYGNSITAYLTYTYNYANGKKTEYGWQNYVESEGDMTQVLEKSIVFSQGNMDLPSGTQLTLVDPLTDKAYYYTTTEEDSTKKVISFASFKDSNGTVYCSKMLGQIMQVKVESDSGGKFIEETNPEKATVFYDGKYYRLANPEDNEANRFKVTISEKDFTEEQMTESYYLVITVPKGNTEPANGYLTTKLSGNVPNNINCLKITGKTDGHDNTASTYNLSDGYKQDLKDSYIPQTNIYDKKITADDSIISILVTDTVTFPNGQLYNDADGLYQRFIANIQSHIKQAGTDIVKSEQFPSGSFGKVSFYVKANNQYWNGSALVGEETVLSSYDWVSDGGNLELPLSDSNGMLIDLANLRNKLKGDQRTGTSSFIIEARIDVKIPATGLDVIPESTLDEQNHPKNFAQLAFTAQISNEGSTLSYSSTKVNKNGNMKYYRESSAGSKLIYDADQIDQLGINLHDLQSDYLNSSNTASRIATTVKYDLSATENLESVLKNSDRVEFTLDLRGRNKDDSGLGYPNECYTDAADYISIVSNNGYLLSETDGVWSMTIPRSAYVDQNGNLRTDGVFDGAAFNLSIDIWVRVNNVESSNHLYDNYKVTLNAKLFDSGNHVIDQPVSDNIIYTLCKIQPEFILRTDSVTP